MASEWPEVPLGELVESGRGISYGIVQPGSHFEGGVPIVRVSDIRNGRISTEQPLRVAPSIEAPYSRTRLKGGELLLTLVGTVGEAAVVPDELAGWNTARAVAVVPVRRDVGAYWVKLALQSPIVRAIIDSRLNTTVQATLNLRDVAQLPILLPNSSEREAVSNVFGTLDSRIELNRAMNETLESITWALFKSWFVDFDPVRAKVEGRTCDLPEGIASLFPDSFDFIENSETPKGWNVLGLDKTGRFLNGLALQKFPPQADRFLPVIKIAQLRTEDTSDADKASADLAPEYIVEDGDVLFSWSGSLECILWAGGKGALNQHLFKVTSAIYPKWFCYLWIHAHLPEFRHIASGKATTMGHIQRGHLSAAKVLVPSPALLKEMDRFFAPLIKQIVNLKLASRTLRMIRDTLLPKLVSGELRVPDVERIVGGQL